jgi:hypothetical protein
VAMEIVDVLKAMLEFGDAAVGGGGASEIVLAEGVEGLAEGGLVEGHDRFAVGFLVASVEEGIERERVVFGSGDFFFDQGAEEAGFDGSEDEVHGEMIHKLGVDSRKSKARKNRKENDNAEAQRTRRSAENEEQDSSRRGLIQRARRTPFEAQDEQSSRRGRPNASEARAVMQRRMMSDLKVRPYIGRRGRDLR